MKNVNNLEAAIASYRLQEVSTTSQMNGYPSHVQQGVVGFDNMADAEAFSQEFGLQLTFFKKKYGWDLWYRTGNAAYEPMKNSSDDYGDNYNQYSNMTGDEYFSSEVKDRLSDFDNMEDLQVYLDDQKEIMDELDKADDTQLVIAFVGKYFETIEKESMSFDHDTNRIAIGCIIEGEEAAE